MRAGLVKFKFSVNTYRDLLLIAILIDYAVPSWDIFWGVDRLVDVTESSGNLTSQVFGVFLFVSALIVAPHNRVNLRRFIFAFRPVLPVLLWAIASVLWSQYPDLTIRRSAHLFLEVVSFSLLILTIEDEKKLLRLLFVAFMTVTALDFICVLFYPQSFTPIGFAGVHGHKNTAGLFYYFAIAVFSIGVYDRKIVKSKLIAMAGVFACLIILYIAQSKTIVLVIPLSILAVILIKFISRLKDRSRIAFISMAAFAGYSVGILLFAYSTEVIHNVFEDPTFTGRTKIWSFVLSQFERRPLSGVGFGALWQSGSEIELWLKQGNISLINEAHNGYVDVLAQLGIVGLILLGLFLLICFRRTIQYKIRNNAERFPGFGDYAVYVFSGSLIFNMSESGFLRAQHEFWIQMIIVSTYVASRLSTKLHPPIKRLNSVRDRRLIHQLR